MADGQNYCVWVRCRWNSRAVVRWYARVRDMQRGTEPKRSAVISQEAVSEGCRWETRADQP